MRCPVLLMTWKTLAAPNADDLYAYDIAASEWTNLSAVTVGPAPKARYAHAFACGGGRLFVFGGTTSHLQGGGQEVPFMLRPSRR